MIMMMIEVSTQVELRITHRISKLKERMHIPTILVFFFFVDFYHDNIFEYTQLANYLPLIISNRMGGIHGHDLIKLSKIFA